MPHRGGRESQRGSLWYVPRAADGAVAVWRVGFRSPGGPELRDCSSQIAGLCSTGRTTRSPYSGGELNISKRQALYFVLVVSVSSETAPVMGSSAELRKFRNARWNSNHVMHSRISRASLAKGSCVSSAAPSTCWRSSVSLEHLGKRRTLLPRWRKQAPAPEPRRPPRVPEQVSILRHASSRTAALLQATQLDLSQAS